MELELGLKLTNVADDFAAAELLIAKDRAGPLFLCSQTDSMFFITAHLKGYRRKNIKIDINEDGSTIGISGEKPVQEMVMVGWQVVKKEIEMRGFKKVFKIPVGVILDKIKARFNEDESVLTISMPKLVKGVAEVGIEELKEAEMPIGETESLQVVADGDNVLEGLKLQQEECPKLENEQNQAIDQAVQEALPSFATTMEKESQEKGTQTDLETSRNIQEQEKKHENDQVESTSLTPPKKETQVVNDQDVVRTDDEPHTGEKEVEHHLSEKGRQRKSKKICAPGIIVGSSLLVSLVVLVIHLIRSNNQTSKKRN